MKWLVDTDFLFALFSAVDVHHKKADSYYYGLKADNSVLLETQLVMQEAATVISRKLGQAEARRFYRMLPELGLEIFRTDQEMEDMAWKLFLKQQEDKTSFIDCANVAAIQQLKLAGIVSFDGFYRRVGVKVYSGA